LTSPDGVTWTPRTTASYGINGIVSTGTAIVAVGDGNSIVSSTDGVTWILQNAGIGASSKMFAVVAAGAQFTAVGENGNIITSPQATAIRSPAGVPKPSSYSGSLVLVNGRKYSGLNDVKFHRIPFTAVAAH